MAKTSEAISGLHCVLHRMAAADTAPSATTQVAQLTSMPDAEVTREVATYHTHGDPWERKVVTTLSVADQDYEAIFIGDDATQTALEPLVVSGAEAFYAITYDADGTYTDGTIERFKGFIKSWSKMASVDEVVKVKFTVCINGEITSTAI